MCGVGGWEVLTGGPYGTRGDSCSIVFSSGGILPLCKSLGLISGGDETNVFLSRGTRLPNIMVLVPTVQKQTKLLFLGTGIALGINL